MIHPMAPHQDESEAEEWLEERPRGADKSAVLLVDAHLMPGWIHVV